jgi:hypothetical protein
MFKAIFFSTLQVIRPKLLCCHGLQRLRKKSLLRVESGPQRLKPDLFLISYVRAKARTLQQPEFFRRL